LHQDVNTFSALGMWHTHTSITSAAQKASLFVSDHHMIS